MSVIIDNKGSIKETDTGIKVNQLPPKAQAYIKSHYKNAKIKEASKIVKAAGEVLTCYSIKKESLLRKLMTNVS